jgi:hypothetical protein
VERRLYPRYQAGLEVREINGRPGAGALLLDFSPMGARLEVPCILSDLVEFSFSFPGAETEIRLVGEVIWILPLITHPGRYQLGVSFFTPRWDLDQAARQFFPEG